MRSAVVTGGSRGIGAKIVERLADAGVRVVAVGRDEAALMAVAKRPGVMACKADLSTTDGIERVRKDAAESLGEIDILVHAAGKVVREELVAMSDAALEEQLRVGLEAPALLTARLGSLLSSGGTVIFLSSTLASRPAPARAAYAASKAGLEGLTRALAVELGPRGIRVNGIAPAVVPTAMILDGLPGDEVGRGAALEELRKLHPLGRLGRVEDIADAVDYLVHAGFVTGTVLTVDGGLTLA